jgi:4-hydroxy-2-oxoglutarate aldolase
MNADQSEKLQGIFAPIATPFTDDEDVDIQALQHNLALYRKSGIRGYLALGSNGENKSLDEEERRIVVETVVQGRGEGQIVLAGVMYEAQRQAERFLDHLVALEVDMALVQSPSYFKKLMTDELLYCYFASLADHAQLPLLLYNSPGFNGITLSFELIGRLSEHPNIVGMKDSSPGCDLQIMQLDSGHFRVMAGSISKLSDFMRLGSIGGTVSLANYCPELAVQLHQSLLHGDATACETLNQKLVSMNRSIAGQFGVPGVKAAMNLRGFQAGIPRKPLCPIGADQIPAIKAALVEVGALPA